LELIRALAEYERLSHLMIATEQRLRESLFGPKPVAEVLLAYGNSECAGFAIFSPCTLLFWRKPGFIWKTGSCGRTCEGGESARHYWRG
jgi:hypothetical protein